LQFVSPFEKVPPVDAEFLGQMAGGRSSGKSPQNKDNLGARVMAARQNGSGEGVEDAATSAAAVLEFRRVRVVMGALAGGQGVTFGAAQSFGPQMVDEEFVGSLLINQIVNRKDHHGLPPCLVS
jgi:hypothetical protein